MSYSLPIQVVLHTITVGKGLYTESDLFVEQEYSTSKENTLYFYVYILGLIVDI